MATMMATAPPLPAGIHLWLTEEMGFKYDPDTRMYRHPTRGPDARVSVEWVAQALATGWRIQTVQTWVANFLFSHPSELDRDDDASQRVKHD